MTQIDLFATLEKIEQVQIVNSNRIEVDDQLFCESQEKLYRDTVALFMSIIDQLRSAQSSYISRHTDIGHFEDRLPEIKEQFIYRICRHFKNKYNVSLNEERIHSKYKRQDVTVELVLDEIFTELGGFNFSEKATKEIKDAMQKIAYKQPIVKGNKLTLQYSILHFDSIWKRLEIKTEQANQIFTALSHFENGSTVSDSRFTNHYIRNDDLKYGDHLAEKHDVNMDKIKSIRFFKNGRIDIEFKSGAAALAFAKDYCGYVEAAKLA